MIYTYVVYDDDIIISSDYIFVHMYTTYLYVNIYDHFICNHLNVNYYTCLVIIDNT